MRNLATLLSLALVVILAPTARGQYRIGPIYPERPSTYWSTGNYDPFQLNWGTGRFDYAPIPYAPQSGGSNYSPFQFNDFTGRWDYVPLPSTPSYTQQSVVVDSTVNPTITPTTQAPSSPQIQVPQPDFNTGQGVEVLARPVEPQWMVRAAERSPKPTTAPTQPQRPAPTPSLAPTTRPSGVPIVSAN